MLPHLEEHVLPVDVRHEHIEKHEIGDVFLETIQPLEPVSRRVHGEPLVEQLLLIDVTHEKIILHEENPLPDAFLLAFPFQHILLNFQ